MEIVSSVLFDCKTSKHFLKQKMVYQKQILWKCEHVKIGKTTKENKNLNYRSIELQSLLKTTRNLADTNNITKTCINV